MEPMEPVPKPDPLDAGLSAAFASTGGPPSVLTVVQRRLGAAPRVSLREEDPATAGASPVIDPSSEERRSMPEGRGNYQLMGEIARGGMGVVLKGHDVDLGRDVALKVLNRDLADRPEILQRFVEEAQIGGQLQHPGIVPVYELGLMADERPYFTMKLVKGRTLSALLSNREGLHSDRRRLLDAFEAVCQTMAYAHSRGVIHRDLKPSNVMVGAFGEVQVVDWGLAKVLARGGTADERRARDARTVHTVLETVRSDGSGSGSHSMAGSVMGTPAYMAPEQAQGQVERLDERADVFALGGILCVILTGLPPYAGEDEDTLREATHARLDGALARLDACGADPALVELARQCLMPARDARPRDAGVVADRLRRHLDSVEERARRAEIEAAESRIRAEEAEVRARAERRARRLTFALASSVLFFVVAAGATASWLRTRERARELEALGEYNAAIQDALALRGQAEKGDASAWDRALAALDRAESVRSAAPLEPAGTPDADLRAELLGLRAAARHRAERERETGVLLAALDEVATSMANGVPDRERMNRRYSEVFAAHGLELDRISPEAAAEALAALGRRTEIVQSLDRWLVTRRYLLDQAGSERLVDVCHALDPDPVRADLREAVLADDGEALRALARNDLQHQPPETLDLLASALQVIGETDEALSVLRQAVFRYPGDFILRGALTAMFHDTPDPALVEEELMHGQVLLALRPESVFIRTSMAQAYGRLGSVAVDRGEPDRAARALENAALLWESVVARTPGDREAARALERVRERRRLLLQK